MVKEFAEGFNKCGVEAYAWTKKISESEMSNIIKLNNVTHNIQINKFRKKKLPNSVRNISWIQDYHYIDTLKIPSIFDEDIVYTMGPKENLGIVNLKNYKGCLYSGVSEDLFKKDIESSEDIDLSLCGFIPFPNLLDLDGIYNGLIDRLKTLNLPKELRKNFKSFIEANYVPLSGSLEPIKIIKALERMAKEFFQVEYDNKLNNVIKRIGLIKSIVYYSNTYPRLLDRRRLADAAIKVSSNVQFYGIGWDSHHSYKKFYRGECNNRDSLIDTYRRTKLNLCNNTHGIILHSRVLECMASGGLVFHHKSFNNSPTDGALIPNIHYVECNLTSLENTMNEWLNAPKNIRYQIKLNARNLVIKNHTWTHRAQQILRDLE